MNRATAATVVRRVTDPGDTANRALVVALGGLALAMSIASLLDILKVYPRAIDLEIPLRAAERWMAGGVPYLEESFRAGAELPPFLYPPYALILYAPLTFLDESAVRVAWLMASIALAVAACRRIGLALWLIPLALLWPPFTEALVGGNVQTAIFAAFVFLLVDREAADPDRAGTSPTASRRTLGRGLVAATTSFLKVSHAHAIVYLVRREPAIALIAVGAIALLAVATLPITGIAIWGSWFEQLARASDPAWSIGGSSVAKLLPEPLGTGFLIGCAAAALIVPRRMAAEWVGILLVLGNPGLRTYYFLFFLPAMARIRPELALVAAFCLATYTQQGWWLGIAIVVGALASQTAYERFNQRAAAPPV